MCIRDSSQVAVTLGYRAQAGAKMLYDFLTEALGPHDTGSVTRTVSAKAGPDHASQGTLLSLIHI